MGKSRKNDELFVRRTKPRNGQKIMWGDGSSKEFKRRLKAAEAERAQRAEAKSGNDQQPVSVPENTETATTAASSDINIFDFRPSYGEDDGDDGPNQPNDLRRSYGKDMVDWYIEGTAVEKSQAFKPQQPKANCECIEKTKLVTLYKLDGNFEQRIAFCSCTPLVQTLLSMQFIPSGAISPNVAVHFSVLKLLQALKTTNQLSNQGFAKALTFVNSKDKPLSNSVLNSCYKTYRQVVQQAANSLKDIAGGEEKSMQTEVSSDII